MLGGEAGQALDDVAWTRRIALVGEERGDRLGVGLGGGSDGEGGVRHEGDGTASTSNRWGPKADRTGSRRSSPSGPGRGGHGRAPSPASATHDTAQPSPFRASVAASRPSVPGSSTTIRSPAGLWAGPT